MRAGNIPNNEYLGISCSEQKIWLGDLLRSLPTWLLLRSYEHQSMCSPGSSYMLC